jgi:quercetin dioxygenase-like cupin family protein
MGWTMSHLAASAIAQPAEIRITTPAEIKWQVVPGGLGVESAVLVGNPGLPGTYVIRMKFPPHVMDRPHRHSVDRHVTVLEGRWAAGIGPMFDPMAAQTLPAGSYMFHPAGAVHWDGSNSDETVIVQIVGEGPVRSEDIDTALPSWVRVP